MTTSSSEGSRHQRRKTQEEIWKEREKRLEELLEKDEPNPEAKEDFNRLLEEMARQSSQ